MKTLYALITLSFFTVAYANNAQAEVADWENSACPVAKTQGENNQAVYFFQHTFGDGTRDLAMVKTHAGEALDIKRVTYAGKKTPACQYKALAITSGGNWGWHLAWIDADVVYYVRMDGEAWVSSPAKKFSHQKSQADHPALLSLGDKVWLVWRETEAKNNSIKNYIVGLSSQDGGKTWDDVKVLATSLGENVYPQLRAENNQAYLVVKAEKESLQVIPL